MILSRKLHGISKDQSISVEILEEMKGDNAMCKNDPTSTIFHPTPKGEDVTGTVVNKK